MCLCEAGTVTFKGCLFKDSQYVGGRSGSLCNLQRHFLVCWKVRTFLCLNLFFSLFSSPGVSAGDAETEGGGVSLTPGEL